MVLSVRAVSGSFALLFCGVSFCRSSVAAFEVLSLPELSEAPLKFNIPAGWICLICLPASRGAAASREPTMKHGWYKGFERVK
jgi:hypothetical protein